MAHVPCPTWQLACGRPFSPLISCCATRLLCLAIAGTCISASGHIITAIVGAGVLGLPKAVALLGWPSGLTLLLIFFLVTLWTSYLLTEVHEVSACMEHAALANACMQAHTPAAMHLTSLQLQA